MMESGFRASCKDWAALRKDFASWPGPEQAGPWVSEAAWPYWAVPGSLMRLRTGTAPPIASTATASSCYPSAHQQAATTGQGHHGNMILASDCKVI